MMKKMVTADEYRHVPTGTLALLAQRLGKVFASSSTWLSLPKNLIQGEREGPMSGDKSSVRRWERVRHPVARIAEMRFPYVDAKRLRQTNSERQWRRWSLSSRSTRVSMMQATDLWNGNDFSL